MVDFRFSLLYAICGSAENETLGYEVISVSHQWIISCARHILISCSSLSVRNAHHRHGVDHHPSYHQWTVSNHQLATTDRTYCPQCL